MKPVVALVGRPNVGKSTLFNRLTKSRDAIVADFAGLTRDRHYGDGHLDGRDFIVIDTGGFEPDKPTGVVAEMAKQTRQAVAEADAVVFVTDIRAGVSGQDHDIARFLRSANKRVFLAVNKAEGMSEAPALAEFHELGIGEPHPVSAAHGQGIRSLMDAVFEGLDIPEADPNDDVPGLMHVELGGYHIRDIDLVAKRASGIFDMFRPRIDTMVEDLRLAGRTMGETLLRSMAGEDAHALQTLHQPVVEF